MTTVANKALIELLTLAPFYAEMEGKQGSNDNLLAQKISYKHAFRTRVQKLRDRGVYNLLANAVLHRIALLRMLLVRFLKCKRSREIPSRKLSTSRPFVHHLSKM